MFNKIKKIIFLFSIFSVAIGLACSGQPIGNNEGSNRN